MSVLSAKEIRSCTFYRFFVFKLEYSHKFTITKTNFFELKEFQNVYVHCLLKFETLTLSQQDCKISKLLTNPCKESKYSQINDGYQANAYGVSNEEAESNWEW